MKRHQEEYLLRLANTAFNSVKKAGQDKASVGEINMLVGFIKEGSATPKASPHLYFSASSFKLTKAAQKKYDALVNTHDSFLERLKAAHEAVKCKIIMGDSKEYEAILAAIDSLNKVE